MRKKKQTGDIPQKYKDVLFILECADYAFNDASGDFDFIQKLLRWENKYTKLSTDRKLSKAKREEHIRALNVTQKEIKDWKNEHIGHLPLNSPQLLQQLFFRAISKRVRYDGNKYTTLHKYNYVRPSLWRRIWMWLFRENLS